MDKIQFEAEVFRGVLEEYFANHPEVSISTNWITTIKNKFPIDHCKATSFLFGYYLIKKCGIKPNELFYVWGTRLGETHGWLRYRNLLVDLTCDQFTDQKSSIIVIEREMSLWHKSFLDQREFEFELREYHPIQYFYEELEL